MKLILLTLLLYTASNLSSPQFFQCKERNNCQEKYLQSQTNEALSELYNLVKQELASKIEELDDYDAEYTVSDTIGKYLSERLGVGLPELADISNEFGHSLRNFFLTANRSGNYDEIKNQLIRHSSAVHLHELIRVLESERETSISVINREKLTKLISAIKNNELCVRSFINQLIEPVDSDNDYRDSAVRLYERLRILLRVIKALTSHTEARLVIQSIREVLDKYRLGDTCRRAWTANIACRTCNNSVTGGPIPRACQGLCSSTLWVCLAPLLHVLRRSNDVIRYKHDLAVILSTRNSSLSAAVPSIGAIADELETLTLRALRHTLNLVNKLPQIAEACDFNAQLPDSETTVNITTINNVFNGTEEEKSTDTDDSITPPLNTDSNVDNGRDSRRRREEQQFSLPLPPQRLVPLFRSIIHTLCTEINNGFQTDRCWNGTQVAPFLYNTYPTDFSLQTMELVYSAAGVEWDSEEFFAETEAISGATDPCEAIQGDSEVYYALVSDESQSVCYEERLTNNGSSQLTHYLSLLALAISLVLYVALL